MKHQQEQIKVVNQIESQVKKNQLNFSTVKPVKNFDLDSRICLTSVHFPNKNFIDQIRHTLINPLKKTSPHHYYYHDSSLHLTIKNIRIINDPPTFSKNDIIKAIQVFDQVIPHHHKFKIYPYRLLLFPSNLALISTTDPELDRIILDLNDKLRQAGIPDDKQYLNSKFFFSNMTLARFSTPFTSEFRQQINQLSENISFPPYEIDSVTLITANASLSNCRQIKTWPLASP